MFPLNTSLSLNSTMNNSSLLDQSESHSSPVMVFLVIMFIIVIAISIAGNAMVIIAIIVDRELQRPQYYLILSLGVADLMVGTTVMPLAAVYEVERKRWKLGEIVCDLWISLDVLCCTASILHLVAIALDRYWTITNIQYAQGRSTKKIAIMIAVIWSVSLVICLAPIMGWKDAEFTERVVMAQECLISQDVAYQIFSTSTAFYIPLIIITILYWQIFKVARKRIRKRNCSRSAQHLVQAIQNVTSELDATELKTVKPICPVNDGYNKEVEINDQCLVRDDICPMVDADVADIAVEKMAAKWKLSSVDKILDDDNKRAFNENGCSADIQEHKLHISQATLQRDDAIRDDDSIHETAGLGTISDMPDHENLSDNDEFDSKYRFGIIDPEIPLDDSETLEMQPGLLETDELKINMSNSQTPICRPTAEPVIYSRRQLISKRNKDIQGAHCVSFDLPTNSPPKPITRRAISTVSHNLIAEKTVGNKSKQANDLTSDSSSFRQHLSFAQVSTIVTYSKNAAMRAALRRTKSNTSKSSKNSMEAKRERKAFTTLAIVTGTFLICWLPFFIIAVIRPACKDCQWSNNIDSITLWLGYGNSIMNPIIYTIFSPDFRAAFKRLLTNGLPCVRR